MQLQAYNMLAYNKLQLKGFIDRVGWEESQEEGRECINPQKRLMRNLEAKVDKRQSKPQRWGCDDLERSAEKETRSFGKNKGAKQGKPKMVEYPCILQTIQLDSNKNKVRYKQSFKKNHALCLNIMSQDSNQPTQQYQKHRKTKLSSQPSLQKTKKSVRLQKIPHLSPKDPFQIDKVTYRYLNQYYSQQKRQKTQPKKLPKIFEIPPFLSLNL